MITALAGGVIFALLSIVNFKDLTCWRTGICISSWGLGSYAGLFVRSRRDPSWTWALICGVLLFSTAFFLFFGTAKYLYGLDLLALAISLTYVGAKMGCIEKKCCRAVLGNRYFNPAVFNSFDWLQKFEFVVSVLLFFCLILLIWASIFPAGYVFEIFLVFHVVLRLFSYSFRFQLSIASVFWKSGFYFFLVFFLLLLYYIY